MNWQLVDTIAAQIVSVVERVGHPVTLTFIEQQVPGFAETTGAPSWIYADGDDSSEVILWDGMTAEGCKALRRVLKEGGVALTLCSPLMYFIAGRPPPSEPDWVPVALAPVSTANMRGPKCLYSVPPQFVEQLIELAAAGGVADDWVRVEPAKSTPREALRMSKRFPGRFPLRENDLYPTPTRLIERLVPHLRAAGVRDFCEPCCGNGDIVQYLECAGFNCVLASDLTTGQDALAIPSFPAAIVTNPPYSRKIRDALIEHFIAAAPCAWLLLKSDWTHNKGTQHLVDHCSFIVPVQRWQTKGTMTTGTDNFAWMRFAAKHTGGPRQYVEGNPIGRLCECGCELPFMPKRITPATIPPPTVSAAMSSAYPLDTRQGDTTMMGWPERTWKFVRETRFWPRDDRPPTVHSRGWCDRHPGSWRT